MPRNGVDTEKVVDLAVQITDTNGIDAVSLKEISARLNIRTPSLYNHIGSLAELKTLISHKAMEMLKEQLIRAAIGQSGMSAIKEMGLAYIRFAKEHPGLFETTQWLNIWSDAEAGSIYSGVIQMVYKICADYGVDELAASHLIRTVRSLILGFSSIEAHQGFGYDTNVEESFEYALDTFLLGMQARRVKT